MQNINDPGPLLLLISYNPQAHKLDAMEFFKKFAVDPEELPDTGEQCLIAGGCRFGDRVVWAPRSCRTRVAGWSVLLLFQPDGLCALTCDCGHMLREEWARPAPA